MVKFMKVSTIPFNMNFYEDDDLKEIPEDIEEMKKGIDFLLEELDRDTNHLGEAGIHSLLGVYNMLVGTLDEALYHLDESQKIYNEEGKTIQFFTARIRAAVVFCKMKKFAKAALILDKCSKKIFNHSNQKVKALADRICIDFGKLKFAQGEFEASLEYFIQAFDLRIIAGDIDKINNVKKYLEITNKKIESKMEQKHE